MFRRVPLALCAAVLSLVTACGAGSGAQTFTRTTLPAADSPNAATDPRLAKDQMRHIDPCQLLRGLSLGSYGGPKGEAEVGDDPSGCDQMLNTDEDEGSTSFRQVSMSLGVPASPQSAKFDAKIGDLPASVLDSGSSCGVTVMTDSKEHRGFELSYSDNGKDLCTPAKDLTSQALKVLRTNPPGRQETPFTAAEPCDLVDGGTVNAIMQSDPEGNDAGLYSCFWQNALFKMNVSLANASTQSGAGAKPIDLGGGTQGSVFGNSGSEQACTVEWVYKPDQRPRELGETPKDQTVSVQVQDRKKSNADVCGKAVQAAKVVAPKLPKQ